MRNVKTAIAATLCALVYYFFDRSPAFACIGAIFGMGLFAIYAELFPDGSNRWLLIPLTFVGVVILIVACQYIWVGGIQPGGVVLCIILFNTPVETYISYALNRILDTGIGVLAAFFVNAMLPGGFTFRFMRRFYAWLGIQSDLDHTGPEVPLSTERTKNKAGGKKVLFIFE